MERNSRKFEPASDSFWRILKSIFDLKHTDVSSVFIRIQDVNVCLQKYSISIKQPKPHWTCCCTLNTLHFIIYLYLKDDVGKIKKTKTHISESHLHWKHSLQPHMCVNPQMKIVPNDRTTSSFSFTPFVGAEVFTVAAKIEV